MSTAGRADAGVASEIGEAESVLGQAETDVVEAGERSGPRVLGADLAALQA